MVSLTLELNRDLTLDLNRDLKVAVRVGHDMSMFSVILAAGGTGTRFGRNKLLEIIEGKSVLQHSIDAFIHRDDVVQVIVAGGDTYQLAEHPKLSTTRAGHTRTETVSLALQAVVDAQWVAVHDAARPMVSQSLIDRLFEATLLHGCAIPAVKITSTIKRGATASLPTLIAATVNRDELFAVQTPQCARTDWLKSAYASLTATQLSQATDDAMLLEQAGRAVMLVEGEEMNLKITTPTDLKIARAISSIE
jgi:2-C-methyl-D-erythritol 4-phosphate cytidylyltransferase